MSSVSIMNVSPLDRGKVYFPDNKHNLFIKPFALKLRTSTYFALTILHKVVPLQS